MLNLKTQAHDEGKVSVRIHILKQITKKFNLKYWKSIISKSNYFV